MMQSTLLTQFGVEELRQVIREELTQIIPSIRPKQETPSDEYLTRFQVARKLHLSLTTLHQYTQSGRLPSYRMGKRVLYKSHEIESALLTIGETKFHNK